MQPFNVLKHATRFGLGLIAFFILSLAGCGGGGGSGSTGTAAVTVRMPDTGQTTSYTNTFGEDADYIINPPSYIDNGDGTIKDNVTGLVWQKQDDATTKTWVDAGPYCSNLTLAGLTGWRLPSRIELVSIVDYGFYNPSINATYFPGTSTLLGYWSSTTTAANTYGAWVEYFGGTNVSNKTYSHYVRCVRGAHIAQNFKANGDGTATDSGTLLTWQQGESTAMTWEAALTYCEGLTLAGQTDWRLPNAKEISSILDDTRFNPAINMAMFPNAVLSFYWSSTTDAGVASSALGAYFDLGYESANKKTNSSYVRCVRGITPPSIISTNPANGTSGVAVNTAITATFSKPMDASTISTATFTLSNGVTGAVTYSGTTATFTPSSNLAYSTTYTATITAGVKDATGNVMAFPYTWTFTTGAVPDTTPPLVSLTNPVDSATGVAVIAAITATFSEPMDVSTVTSATFTLNNGVTGTVTYSGTTATFTPSSSLASSTTYTATINTGVKDAAGNAMASNYTWTFSTGTVPGVTSKLNDTGITASQCYQTGSDTLVACNSAGAMALNNAQDGMAGRDVDGATNSNADGKLGFSFTSIAGGCVLDNVTGLMWEVKTTDGGLRDWSNTYTNYDSTTEAQKLVNSSYYVAPTQADIDAATNSVGFKNSVNAQGLCGYNDWRLPTADELQSIVDYSVVSGTTIDAIWFPNTQRVYWSASARPDGAWGAWYVDFNWGDVVAYFRNSSYNVRLVRAGGSQTTPRYTVSTDGQEVTDSQTNLIWRRCSEGMNWDGATCAGTANVFTHEQALQLAAAEASSTGIAWRLPSVKELASIADKSLFNPAVDSTAFPATPSSVLQMSYFWSASPFFGYGVTTGLAWSVDFTTGGVNFINRSNYPLYVRLVRAGQ